MLVKNVSARGWFVGGTIIAPLETKEVDVSEADIKGNADLEVVKSTEKKLSKKEQDALDLAEKEAKELAEKEAKELAELEALEAAKLAGK